MGSPGEQAAGSGMKVVAGDIVHHMELGVLGVGVSISTCRGTWWALSRDGTLVPCGCGNK